MKRDSAPHSATLPVVDDHERIEAPSVSVSMPALGGPTVPLGPPPVAAADDAPAARTAAGADAPRALAPAMAPLTRFSPRARVRILAVLAGLGFLFLLRIGGILTPFLWAIVVAYAFNPLVYALCRRTRLPRLLVVIGLYAVGIAALAAVLSAAIPRLNEQIGQLANNLPTMATDLYDRYFGSPSQPIVIGPFSINVPQVTRQIVDSLNHALNNFAGGTITATISTIERLTQFLLFLIVTFYLLVDAPKFGPYFTNAAPPRYRDEALLVARRVDAVLSQYLRAELVLIAIMSVASFVVLSIMGVRFAIVLAPIAGVLEIFPFIGPFAAITLVTIMALFSPNNFGLSPTGSAVIVCLVFFVLRQIEDYAVIPNVVGHAVKLHPALILFAVAAGATFGGALGLFIAVPVTGALKVLGGYLYEKMA